MKELNSNNIIDIPNYVDLFKTYDIDLNHYIKGEDFARIFYEINESIHSRKKINEVLQKLEIKPASHLNFLDFLKIMSVYNAKEQNS